MATEQFSNKAQTTLNGAIDGSQTSIIVTSNSGFPTSAQFRIIIDSEIMLVTAGMSGLTWTVTRGNNLASPDTCSNVSHTSGTTITQVLTAGGLTSYVLAPVSGAVWAASTLLTLGSIANSYGLIVNGPAGAGTSFGIKVVAGTNASDYSARFQTQGAVDILSLRGDGQVLVGGSPAVLSLPGAGQAKVIGGTTGIAFRNSADSANNLSWPDNGRATFRNGLALLGTTIDVGAGCLGSVEVSATQGTFTALTDLTNLTLTVTPATGRKYRIAAQVPLSSSIAADIVAIALREGATVLQGSQAMVPSAGGFLTLDLEKILVGDGAAHTYKLSAERSAGTGNITMQAGAVQVGVTYYAHLLIQDIGT